MDIDYMVIGRRTGIFGQVGFNRKQVGFFAKVWKTHPDRSTLEFEAEKVIDLCKLEKLLAPYLQIDGLTFTKLFLDDEKAEYERNGPMIEDYRPDPWEYGD